MNVNSLITRVKTRVGRPDDDTTLDDPILYALNTVQRENVLSLNIQELLTTSTLTLAASTQSYDLASDFLKMRMIWANNTYDHELLRIFPEEYKNYLSDVDTTEGTPYYYDIYDESSGVKRIHLFPVPSAAATTPYYYYKSVADLASGGAETVLTKHYPDLYIEGAAYILYRDSIYRDQPEKIAFRERQYQKQVEIVRIAQRQPDRVDKVSPKRLLPTSIDRLYTTQWTGYTS